MSSRHSHGGLDPIQSNGGTSAPLSVSIPPMGIPASHYVKADKEAPILEWKGRTMLRVRLRDPYYSSSLGILPLQASLPFDDGATDHRSTDNHVAEQLGRYVTEEDAVCTKRTMN